MPASETSTIARALGRIPSGLFVVTTLNEREPVGFVGSLLMQIGFEPPTVCVAVGRTRPHLEYLRRSGHFAVTILDKPSSGLMAPFFKKSPDGKSPFDGLNVLSSPVGSPVLGEGLAWLACRVVGDHAAGDHVAVFGEVVDGALLREGDPTIHLRKNGLSY